MNYDRIISELLNRIVNLEEKVEKLEKLLSPNKIVAVNTASKDKNKRDKTKYIFEGRTLLKNHLVHEVVKKYVKDHPNITFDQLQQVFYDKLQGSFGVVRIKDAIEPKNFVRYFMKDEETLYLTDGTKVVVSNQWGKTNIIPFIVYATSLGYEINEL